MEYYVAILRDDPRFQDLLVGEGGRGSRAAEKSQTQGFMKILVEAASKEILGAAVPSLDVMYAKAPYTVIQRAVHIHPSVWELIPTMLGDLEPLE